MWANSRLSCLDTSDKMEENVDWHYLWGKTDRDSQKANLVWCLENCSTTTTRQSNEMSPFLIKCETSLSPQKNGTYSYIMMTFDKQ